MTGVIRIQNGLSSILTRCISGAPSRYVICMQMLMSFRRWIQMYMDQTGFLCYLSLESNFYLFSMAAIAHVRSHMLYFGRIDKWEVK